MFKVQLEIIPQQVSAWSLKPGERFTLSATGYNPHTERYEVYVKISRTKCVLDSDPEKPKISIPVLLLRYQWQVYRSIDKYELV